MKNVNLKLYIKAMAVMVRVDGMKSENKAREQLDLSLAYQEDSFELMAQDLDRISRGIDPED